MKVSMGGLLITETMVVVTDDRSRTIWKQKWDDLAWFQSTKFQAILDNGVITIKFLNLRNSQFCIKLTPSENPRDVYDLIRARLPSDR